MNFIKTSLLIITVSVLTACKTVPTAPEQTTAQETEQTEQSRTSATTQETTPKSSNNDESAQDAGEQASVPNASESLTSEEQAQQFDQQLDDQFADFDRLLLREREFLSEKQKEQGAPQNEGGGGAAGGSLDGYDGLDDFDESTADGSSPPNGNTQQPAGESAYPSSNTNINTPPDLVNTKGDDVIARQLREAAQKEKDPVLREKLWDEYRKYKSGI